ncbi:MAG: acyl-CoA dehydrogenase [Myxococcota bacterium]|nr:acyl-CoA dehydrogenase [Myxococcota bacterium]
MHEAVAYIHEHGDALRDEHVACDEAGKLTDVTASLMRSSGGMRMLQARSHGGFETEPSDFFEWVRAVGRYNASAGWVAGVVGVHPWEVALVEPALQDEIYGNDPDVWVASPYVPQGRAVREGDGFRFSGRWQYSTGTDHCGWVVLGGLVVDENGSPGPIPDLRHFFLPRGDYEIVEDSWKVMGLSGTGSKDILIEGAFVPEYRTIAHGPLAEGEYASRQLGNALYQLPFGCVFSAAIGSALFGIAQGALDRYRDYVRNRVSVSGVVGKTDPYQQEALAELEADLAAGIVHVDAMLSEWGEQLAKGDPITTSQRLEFRRNQVRASQRVLFGVDKLFSRSGSAAVWATRPLERYWRDVRTAGSHICNMADVVYGRWADHEFGNENRSIVMY